MSKGKQPRPRDKVPNNNLVTKGLGVGIELKGRLGSRQPLKKV